MPFIAVSNASLVGSGFNLSKIYTGEILNILSIHGFMKLSINFNGKKQIHPYLIFMFSINAATSDNC